jgi:SagB-type dehydrogenase family enzyme
LLRIENDNNNGSGVFVRRSKCLNLYWNNDGFIFENYLTQSKVISNPLLAHMLGELTEFRNLHQVRDQYARQGNTTWQDVIQTLIERNILIVKGSPQDVREKILETWKWDQPARYFHFATRDVNYSFSPKKEQRYFRRLAKTNPPPSHYKDYLSANFTKLANDAETSHLETNERLSSILLRRRTIRNFERKSITFEQFSRITSMTWGKTSSIDEGEIQRRVIKRAPSGGCRHPIEVYPIINRVKNLRKGIYHYSVRRNGLELLRLGNFEKRITKYCSGQPWFASAAVIFVMTAILGRSMWRYNNSRTYRIIQMDAGHLAQNFHLITTSLNLGPLTTAGIQDTQLEESLGIDGIKEIVVYLCAVGIPAMIST